MAQIIFDIDDAKIPRIINAMKGLYPIPYTLVDDVPVPDFTPAQWAKEAVRRWALEYLPPV